MVERLIFSKLSRMNLIQTMITSHQCTRKTQKQFGDMVRGILVGSELEDVVRLVDVAQGEA